MFDATISDGVIRVRGTGVQWLSSGWNGGWSEGPAAYNISVPAGWECSDTTTYVTDRLTRAGFADEGPCLLTAVDLCHARGAKRGSVRAIATVGVSNPASLPLDSVADRDDGPHDRTSGEPGTVNVIVGAANALEPSALVSLLGGVVEAKTATLMQLTGFTGTTTDAVIVGCPVEGSPIEFVGSATEIGLDTRACVREAVCASFRSRYVDQSIPATVRDAEYGTVTRRRAEVFDLSE